MAEYINRELLLKRFCEKCNESMEDEPCEPADCFAMAIIKSLPKVDVAAVRHARWIPEENGDVYFSCSYCGCEISTSWDYDDLEWNFCPECGCAMDGGADNGE